MILLPCFTLQSSCINNIFGFTFPVLRSNYFFAKRFGEKIQILASADNRKIIFVSLHCDHEFNEQLQNGSLKWYRLALIERITPLDCRQRRRRRRRCRRRQCRWWCVCESEIEQTHSIWKNCWKNDVACETSTTTLRLHRRRQLSLSPLMSSSSLTSEKLLSMLLTASPLMSSRLHRGIKSGVKPTSYKFNADFWAEMGKRHF